MKFLKLFDEMNTSIDSDLIFEIFNEIKDDFDLEKIDIDDVVRYTGNPRLYEVDFTNSYYFSQSPYSESVIVSIFYKSEVSPSKVTRLDLEPKFVNISTFEQLLKEEYPELYNSVCNFIDSVERSEMVECYWHSTLRHGFSFSYYHFKLKKFLIIGLVNLFNKLFITIFVK